MIATNLSIFHNGDWTKVAVIASIVGGIVLVYLLVWATIKIVNRKEVSEMSERPRFIIETTSRLLFLYWIYITAGPIPTIIWTVFILWDGFRSLKQLLQ